MSQNLERAASLVVYTNARLQGQDIEYTSDHSTIKFSRHVPRPEGALPDAVYDDTKVIARNPFAWSDYLKREGISCVKLHYFESGLELPDHVSAAFVGGGSMLAIEALHGARSDVYVEGSRAPTSSKNLGLHYLLVEKDVEPVEDAGITVDQTIDKLGTILEKLENFAREHERIEHWAQNFQSARKLLSGEVPKYYDELFPLGLLPEKNRQLIAGALGSWVFGGMGSWNDDGFGEGAELGTDLYKAIHDGVSAAVNTSR
ncbi:MAG: hypothetical protein ACFFCS_10985 [Candidatus Hodarchaeota archaeon]